jgi:hypothetical protein
LSDARTEKARQCDNARANEERIRKLAEDREVRLQRELTNEVQAQRLLEKRANEQAQRIAELEDRLQVEFSTPAPPPELLPSDAF